jgi:hypothetical protein
MQGLASLGVGQWLGAVGIVTALLLVVWLEAPPVLDVAYLSTLALLAARLPLDPVFATRAALLKEEPATYFDIASRKKRRFHRALVEAGMIDLA